MMPKTAQKKIIAFFYLILSLLILFSCTHKPVHPIKTEKEWAADHEACEKWAREGIRDEPDTYDALDEMKMVNQCMKQKGWIWERTGLFNFKNDEEK